MNALTFDPDRSRALREAHPEVFRRDAKRFLGPLALVGVVLYGFYCWWFFDVSRKLEQANWSIAGQYLADWVSWEARPDLRVADDGTMELRWPRFSPLGAEPDPEWVDVTRETVVRRTEREVPANGGTAAPAPSFMNPSARGSVTTEQATRPVAPSFMNPSAQGTATGSQGGSVEGAPPPQEVREERVTRAAIDMGAATILAADGVVTVTHEGERLRLRIDGETTQTLDPLPDWASQRFENGKVRMSFGFAGRLEVDEDSVKVRRRFLGWENFWFDTRSPFWGRSAGEVIGLMLSGERVDPTQSNLSRAWNDFLYNAEWQHLDVWIKLLQTIIMAFVGTIFAGVVAFPLAFMAARNITRSTVVNQVTKRFFDFLRSVDMLIWALFFTRAFGPGPLAGISAIFFTDTGTLGKLYSEALENVDDKQREGVRSVGAAPALVQRYGVLPQVLPLFASQVLYFWESNTRSATIIGAVGAGGIGLKLWEAMRTNQDWENVAYMVILILVVVYVFDGISNALRARLMGRT